MISSVISRYCGRTNTKHARSAFFRIRFHIYTHTQFRHRVVGGEEGTEKIIVATGEYANQITRTQQMSSKRLPAPQYPHLPSGHIASHVQEQFKNYALRSETSIQGDSRKETGSRSSTSQISPSGWRLASSWRREKVQYRRDCDGRAASPRRYSYRSRRRRLSRLRKK